MSAQGPVLATFRGSLASSGKWLGLGDAGDSTARFDLVVADLPEVVKLAAHGQEELEFVVRHVKECEGKVASE
ncbi:MAG: hypothetical protein ACRDM7_12030 [Thermoleophilaceae bacterium]